MNEKPSLNGNGASSDVDGSEHSDEDDSGHVEGMDCDDSGQSIRSKQKVYIPGKDMLNEDEHLVCDESVYLMLHEAQTGSPCLSFDILKDHLGEMRNTFPHTFYLVAGTQSANVHLNSVLVLKMSELSKTQTKDEYDSLSSDEDESEDDEKDLTPEMECSMIPHSGCINRIRATRLGGKHIAATWSELKKVHIWDLSLPLLSVEDSKSRSIFEKEKDKIKPIFTFDGHHGEGFAVDWSPVVPGLLATGDVTSCIHIWKPSEGGTWDVCENPYKCHTASVEDIQWSPNEETVFASCSVDHSIHVWDIRASPSAGSMLKCENAHNSDVNVINWNRSEPFILSGGDDGIVSVWDLRHFKDCSPVARFKHHAGSVTSVEWNPNDSAVFASSGSDDQVVLWDLSVEKDDTDDDDHQNDTDELKKLPPQLLFIHQGQKDIKEIHWHSQIPGLMISTAESGFNIFKTISV